MDGPLSVYPSPVDEHLSCFHLLAFVNGAAASIHVLVFVCTSASSSFGHVPRSGIAETYSNSTFNFLRNQQIVFHSGCMILSSYQLCKRVPISSHPHQPLLFSTFLIIAILVGMQWYPIIRIFIPISSVTHPE